MLVRKSRIELAAAADRMRIACADAQTMRVHIAEFEGSARAQLRCIAGLMRVEELRIAFNLIAARELPLLTDTDVSCEVRARIIVAQLRRVVAARIVA